MKRILFPLMALALALPGMAAQRQTINFNHDWEMYPILADELPKLDFNVRTGTDFEGQFDHQHVPLESKSAQDAAKEEVEKALKGYEAEYPGISGKDWEKVSLPHPARYEHVLQPAAHHFSGICYYRKKFDVPAGDGQVYIKFEGAMQQASIWVNGKYVMQNQGGYLPFLVYLNPYVKRGGENEIVVRLDNRENPNTPPGRPLNTNGFLYWSGIYRTVSMEIAPDVHISDPVLANKVAGGGVFVRYDHVSEYAADVLIKTDVRNATDSKQQVAVRHTLIDGKGNKVKVSDEVKVELAQGGDADVNHIVKVMKPRLWSTDEPNLYTLVSEVVRDGKVIDRISQRIGIRSISFTRGGGFKLNGKYMQLVGSNRHEDHPYIGNSLSYGATYRDLKRMKDAGMNLVRIGHYPNSPDVYDICDELGMVVIDPIPGWQFFNANDIFKERVFRDIRQMVRRDRNHPCVVLWEASLNESYPPDEFRIESAMVAHEEYPGDQFYTCGDTYGAKKTAWDVPYSLWGGDPFRRPQTVQPDRPGLAREYGDYEFGGARSTTRMSREDGEKGMLQNAWNLQWEYNTLISPYYYPWNVGIVNWAFFDGFETFTPNLSKWGIMDVFRTPKFAWYMFQSQRTAGTVSAGEEIKPMAFIANWWTEREKDKVVVYSNCDEIELFINGKSVRKQKPDSGPETVYGDFNKGGNPFDGGNADNMAHPPFTFMDVAWEKGELKAVGYIKGNKSVEYSIRTPEKAEGLKLVVDTQGMDLNADGADVVFVHAHVVDKNGTIAVTDNDTKVVFKVEGEAILPCPVEAKARAGIASVLIRSTTKPGSIRIKAVSSGLGESSIDIKSVKP